MSINHAIFFDFNGVLAKKSSDQEALIAKYFNINESTLDTFLSKIIYQSPLIDLWREIRDVESEKRYLNKYGEIVLKHFNLPIDKDNINKIIELKFTNIFTLPDDVIPTLEKLSKCFKIGILTNSRPSRRTVEISRMGLDRYCDPDLIIISREVGYDKPDKRIYELAIQRTKVDPKNIVFCDNKVELLEAAEECGIKELILFTENNDKYFCVDRFSQILDHPFIKDSINRSNP